MFEKLLEDFLNLFRKKDVNQVLSSFTKVMRDLEELDGRHQKKILKKQEAIAKAEVAVAESQLESQRAAAVKARIQTIIS